MTVAEAGPAAVTARSSLNNDARHTDVRSRPAASRGRLAVANDPARVDPRLAASLRGFYGLSATEAEIAIALSTTSPPRKRRRARRLHADHLQPDPRRSAQDRRPGHPRTCRLDRFLSDLTPGIVGPAMSKVRRPRQPRKQQVQHPPSSGGEQSADGRPYGVAPHLYPGDGGIEEGLAADGAGRNAPV